MLRRPLIVAYSPDAVMVVMRAGQLPAHRGGCGQRQSPAGFVTGAAAGPVRRGERWCWCYQLLSSTGDQAEQMMSGHVAEFEVVGRDCWRPVIWHGTYLGRDH